MIDYEIDDFTVRSPIAINISYSKSGITQFTIVFNTYVREFSWLAHSNNETQYVHPCDLDVSPTLVTRYMFYKNQVNRLAKDGILPIYAEELMTLLESQILDTVRDYVEPTQFVDYE
jgi:hypothetical protein